MVCSSTGLVPGAIFALGRSNLEGDRRGAPSGDLVFASSGASARRLLGDTVFIVFYSSWIQTALDVNPISSLGKVPPNRVSVEAWGCRSVRSIYLRDLETWTSEVKR